MTARLPPARPRGRLYGLPEIAYLRVALELHDQAECDLPDCPVQRLSAFLADLEQTVTELGAETIRPQIWASIQAIAPPPPPCN